MWVHGCWPPHEIDHINRNRADNRLSNLRLATSQENKGNTRILASNKSGMKGVYWHKLRGKWAACISVNNANTHLGLFASKEEASAASRKAAAEHFGEYAG